MSMYETPGGAQESLDIVRVHAARQEHPAAAGESEKEERVTLGGKRADAVGRERRRFA
jgi:hypothetical protein